MTTLLRYSRDATEAPDGLAPVTTQHHRPDRLSDQQRQGFDMEVSQAPTAPHIPGHEVRLMMDPDSQSLYWYARAEPTEEGGEPGEWFLVQEV